MDGRVVNSTGNIDGHATFLRLRLSAANVAASNK